MTSMFIPNRIRYGSQIGSGIDPIGIPRTRSRTYLWLRLVLWGWFRSFIKVTLGARA